MGPRGQADIAARKAMLVAQPLEDPFGRVPLFAWRHTVLVENAINHTREGIQLGTANRLAAPIARRRRIQKHLGYRLAVKAKNPRRLANGHILDMARAPNSTI